MKWNTTDFLRKAQHPLLVAAGSIPLGVLLVMSAAPELLWRMLAFPAAFVLLSWGCILLPGRKRLAAGAAGAALLVALGFLLLPAPGKLSLLILPALYAGLLLAMLPVGGWPRGQELPVGWPAVGVLAHVAAQIFVNVARRNASPLYGPAEPLLGAFLLLAALVVLALNRASLDSAAMSRRTVPTLIRRQNIILTLGLLALAVAIAAIPAIGSALERLWELLMRGVALAAAMLAALFPRSESAGGAPAAAGEASFDLGETQGPSELALLLEKIIGWAAVVILVIALFFAGRALLKKLLRLLKYLWGRMGQYAALAVEDYEDEITSTRDEPDTEREGLWGRLRSAARTREKGLTPAQQVRSRYRRLRRRHAEWGRASTARETLPEGAAALYERARYSDHPVTEADAARFQEETKRI